MKKKDFVLSLIGVLIVLIGAVVVCCMGFPAGLLLIIPTGAHHFIRLYHLMKEKSENQCDPSIKK